jgi:hypothetical protein
MLPVLYVSDNASIATNLARCNECVTHSQTVLIVAAGTEGLRRTDGSVTIQLPSRSIRHPLVTPRIT